MTPQAFPTPNPLYTVPPNPARGPSADPATGRRIPRPPADLLEAAALQSTADALEYLKTDEPVLMAAANERLAAAEQAVLDLLARLPAVCEALRLATDDAWLVRKQRSMMRRAAGVDPISPEVRIFGKPISPNAKLADVLRIVGENIARLSGI